MAISINNPIPRSLLSECKKVAKILTSFIKPNQVLGATEVIPPEILREARGLVVLTVLKAGFLFSGRAGSGLIIARLPDGSWSAPSAIATAGAGVGGQIGAELTDFVFILNSDNAVESFAQYGSVTLGGNLSVALGPVGRSAEAAATASLRNTSAVFSYSKTKGAFAGVSLEGSAIVERRDANSKFYGSKVKARAILAGRVDPPPECDVLFRVLNSKVFRSRNFDDDYDDLPTFSDEDSFGRSSTRGSRARHTRGDDSDDDVYGDGRRSTGRTSVGDWEDDVYDRSYSKGTKKKLDRSTKPNFSSTYSDHPEAGQRYSPSPVERASPAARTRDMAVAMYTFDGEQPGDLPFIKGDTIEIVKKSNSQDDWWTGRANGKEGIFPANYVKMA
ncbi:hypothetical protein BABINDRAFT_163338 [Babjeviella inositovora NRRL Y-12698]|uniref:SH3 domain-containing protein n=1 Tax=Babjeviella inositovora NRRL Y-12698 TaxID=984486 RepID=A0A1E3QIU8_9ASCO|nr:uncharacterized protein BABINDRAFT_163338 [Babjeviella inositovora NRRL Y-12698]ODQ77611.1 hypothetical protein BABINDRAFT_163338 [Babjeviella inositovora NRRL Y-12698]